MRPDGAAEEPPRDADGARWIHWSTHARSYELDSFGHVNHAVHLNWFEQARFATLEAVGFPAADLLARRWGIHVVRVEVDYRKEARMGDRILIRTRTAELRNSSMTLHQQAHLNGEGGPLVAEARVVLVWIGPDGSPMRIPAEVRQALSAALH